jgi:hypothetical protein
MNPDVDIKETLTKLRNDFQQSAIKLMSEMFGIHPEIRNPWEIVETFDGNFDYIFSLKSENKHYNSHTIIGMAYSTLEKILWKDVSLAEAKDALSEFANCYNGVLMDLPVMVDNFGYMRQFPPEDATTLACFPVAWGIHGTMYIDTESVFIRFSMEKRKFLDDLMEQIN